MKRAALAILLIALPLFAQEPAPAPITADQLWNALQQGNKQFAAGNLKNTTRKK